MTVHQWLAEWSSWGWPLLGNHLWQATLISFVAFAAAALLRKGPARAPLARAARITGSVVVEVTVDEVGAVISARAISGHPLLKDAAVTAARQWLFKPTTLSGVPVKVIGTLTFNFEP